MKAKLTDLHIREIIIHPIRRWKPDHGADLPRQTPAKGLSTINHEEREFLQDKMAQAGSSRTHDIQPEPTMIKNGNEQPDRIMKLLQGRGDLVKDSIQIADDLAAAQGKQTGNDYLLLIGTGKCKNQPVVFMFTMQGEQAIQAINGEPGKPIELQKIKSLVLNQKAKLEKMVVFEMNTTHAIGIVEDSVMKGGAQYFLQDFLGCETIEKSWKHTQQFYKATMATINSSVVLEADKIALTDALHAEIRAVPTSIDIEAFAQKHVNAAYRPMFEAELAKRKLGLFTINKDTRLIEADMKALTYHLSSGIMVRLSNETPEGSVEVVRDREEGDYLKVKGTIQRIGRGTKRKPAKKSAKKQTRRAK